MALRLEDKKAIVAEVNEAAASALSAVLADYRGLTVAQMTELRAKARESGVYLRVVQNTLAKRAVQGTNFECLSESLTGPTLFALSQDEPGSAARLLKTYVKEFEKLEVKAVSIGGELLDASQLEALSKLPTREEALATLMRTMQAPITKLAQTMQAVPVKLVRTLVALRDDKQAA